MSKQVESYQARRERAAAITGILKEAYPEAKIVLHFENPFQLLIATILAAQCTDLRVNMVTPGLFRSYPTPQAFLDLPIEEVLARMSWRPAAVAGLGDTQGGPVAPGRPANLCVIDPTATWTVEAGRTASRSRNIPYVGRTLTGKVRHTITAGEPVVIDATPQR